MHTNHPSQATRHTRSLLIATLILAVLAAFGSVLASRASAGSFTKCSETLLEKAQFCVGEMSSEYLYFIDGENVTNENAVCVGPVRWNGKEYEYPYGWSCGGPKHSWEFEPISGVEPAVENPNSAKEAIGGAFTGESAPRAATYAATSISSSQATLHGEVFPESGFNAHYYFEYGKTTSYGSSTSEQSAGEAYSKYVSATVSALEEGTTYHYRLVLKWSNKGTHYSYGSDQAFTTAGPYPYLGIVQEENGKVDVEQAPFSSTGWAGPLTEKASQIALSGKYLAILRSSENGSVYVEEAPFGTTGWKLVTEGASQIALSGSRLAIVRSSEKGSVYAEEAPFTRTGWTGVLTEGASQIALSGSRLAIVRSSEKGSVYAEEAPFTRTGWTGVLTEGASQIALSGSRLAIVRSSEKGSVYAEEAPFTRTGWTGVLTEGASQIALSGSRLAIVRSSEKGSVYAEEAPFTRTGWTGVLTEGASEIALSGKYLAILRSSESGKAYAEEAPFTRTGWTGVLTEKASQIVLSN